ncbi:MAG TPA: helix-hairpin-helix domain-containing protein [Syntrophales bacterium]|nr:helix-hairpin-helix domain-containing protein [Syntrophales bacterium]
MVLGITERQLDGAVVVIVIAVFIYTAASAGSLFDAAKCDIPYGDKSYGPLIVAISGDADFNGIYHISGNTRICDLLISAGIANLETFDKIILSKKLSTGDVVIMESGNQLTTAEMNNAQKVALNIPIDINKATLNDLTLIPGIGEKTAWKIIQFRERSGRFSKLEDLMKIRGIKEKKFTKIKRYLCTNQIS